MENVEIGLDSVQTHAAISNRVKKEIRDMCENKDLSLTFYIMNTEKWSYRVKITTTPKRTIIYDLGKYYPCDAPIITLGTGLERESLLGII